MIIKKQLAERVEYLRKITGVDWAVGYWNGYAHIYDKKSGDMLISGSKRECYYAILYYTWGYRRALDR